jgi:hypothetical protein
MTASRTCAHCGAPIPDSMRRGTRFCKASCRVNHHIKTKPAPTLSDDVNLNAAEAGLLIDAAAPWLPYVARGWPMPGRDQGRAKRVQRAWRRLAALGLVRVGKARGLALTAIERTDAGAALLARRHNELHAMAERGNGRPLSDLLLDRPRSVFWRDGGHTMVRP